MFLRAPNSHPLSSMLTYVRVFTVRIANIFSDNLVRLTNGECRFARAVFSNTKSVRNEKSSIARSKPLRIYHISLREGFFM